MAKFKYGDMVLYTDKYNAKWWAMVNHYNKKYPDDVMIIRPGDDVAIFTDVFTIEKTGVSVTQYNQIQEFKEFMRPVVEWLEDGAKAFNTKKYGKMGFNTGYYFFCEHNDGDLCDELDFNGKKCDTLVCALGAMMYFNRKHKKIKKFLKDRELNLADGANEVVLFIQLNFHDISYDVIYMLSDFKTPNEIVNDLKNYYSTGKVS